ncbi:CDP-glycerol glycerophosphotransferase family protein [Methanobrevibacter millerae]|uniref:CDP-glycerol glycerophosphotransferase, TagB/SpsB family n=1 Tax=Methanobrevibacter millerae TaxID=230361 RepID=A0A1G5WYJ5_9EURY|nr:CDP-glycerol glycerophosphotransferase family protein [Methanobrevibacter millerae]SDA62597.1 CDP-glycerol glycerophosphotransferase, TagB/SpsB family [Methanobrevibacter millerae]
MSKPFSLKIINSIFKIISSILPVKRRVLFLGSPRNATLMENDQLVYDALTCDKKVIIKPMPHTLRDIFHISFFIMTSKVIVLDDNYRYFAYIPLKNNQKLVQLWHGPGAFKKVALALPNHPIIEEYTHAQYDAFIISSPHVSDHFENCFKLSPNRIKPLGYPLSDLLINNKTELKHEFLEKFPELENKNIILYLPTYRRYEHMELLDFDYGIDWEQLNQYLTETHSVFLVKRHPLQIHDKIEFVPKNYERIIDLGDVSYLSLMVGADVFITDYSSAFFDYLLLDKPIIFYCTDSEEYISKTGIYLKFPEDLPGHYCKTFNELLDTLNNLENEVNYKEFKDKYMESCDGHSTEKVVNLIMGYLE